MLVRVPALTPAQLSAHRHAQARMARIALYIYEMESVLGQLPHDEYGAVLLALRHAREAIAEAQLETATVGRPWAGCEVSIRTAS